MVNLLAHKPEMVDADYDSIVRNTYGIKVTSGLGRRFIQVALGERCEDCGESIYDKFLVVHHLCYERGMTLDNVALLCLKCHKRRHEGYDVYFVKRKMKAFAAVLEGVRNPPFSHLNEL